MGLEAATTIATLDATWPLANDQKLQGDDHIRMIKSILKSTFKNVSGEMWRAVSLGSPTALANTHNFAHITVTAGVAITAVAATVGSGWCVFITAGAVGVTVNTVNLRIGETVIVLSNGTGTSMLFTGFGRSYADFIFEYSAQTGLTATDTFLIQPSIGAPLERVTLGELQSWLTQAGGLTSDFSSFAVAATLAGTDLIVVNQGSSLPKQGTIQKILDWIVTQSITFANAIAIAANLTFNGNARRLLADMSNATIANRFGFKTSTTNGATLLSTLPNGSGSDAGINFFNAEDPTNASQFQMTVSSITARINSAKQGSGTTLPLVLAIDTVEAGRIDTSRRLLFGATAGSDFDLGAPNAKSLWETTQAGTPVTSGTVDNSTAHTWKLVSVRLDMGVYSSGVVWWQPRLITNLATNFGITLCPNGGLVSVGASGFDSQGYLRHGDTAPRTKTKKLTVTTNAAAGGTASVAHGLTSSKIVGLKVVVGASAGTRVLPGSPTAANAYQVHYDTTNVVITNGASSGATINNQPAVIMVEFEE